MLLDSRVHPSIFSGLEALGNLSIRLERVIGCSENCAILAAIPHLHSSPLPMALLGTLLTVTPSTATHICFYFPCAHCSPRPTAPRPAVLWLYWAGDQRCASTGEPNREEANKSASCFSKYLQKAVMFWVSHIAA